MPTFFPRIPATFAISFSIPSLASGYWLGAFRLTPSAFQSSLRDLICFSYLPRASSRAKPCRPSGLSHIERVGQRPTTTDQRLLVLFSKRLDLHIHTGGEIQLH